MSRTKSRIRTSVAYGLTLVIAAVLAVGVTRAPGVRAHDDGTTAHLWLDHIKPMKDPGTINDASNPVDWTRLKGVPADIADGTDDGVELPGSGLKKTGNVFSVDPTKAQRRVTGSCPTAQAIRSIDALGAVTCSAGPRGRSKTIADAGPMCNNECTVGTLVLTPGTWSISAKLTAAQSDVSEDSLVFACHLDAGGSSVPASHELLHSWGVVTLRMQLIATISSNLHASLICGDGDIGEVETSNVSIMAIGVSL